MGKFKTFEDMKHNIPEGATHYRDEDDKNLFTWVKVAGGVEIWCDVFCQWKSAGAHVNLFMSKITPIKNQPKRTRTEYEKVTESIFDLRDEFERGELYCKNLSGSDDYQKN